MQIGDIQEAVRRTAGSRYTDELWAYLRDNLFVSDGPAYDRSDLEEAVKATRAFLAVPFSGGGVAYEAQRQHHDKASGARLTALTELLAAEAAIDESVVAIRQQVGAPMDWDDVEGWIQSQLVKDGPTRRLVEAPLPPTTRVERVHGELVLEPAMTVSRVTRLHDNVALAFVVPYDDNARYVRTPVGGLLEELELASTRIATRFAWHPAQATTWILTDIPPAAALMLGEELVTDSGFGSTTRIVLTIDPAASGLQVEQFYRRVRGQRKQRTIKVKSATLAAFVASHSKGRWRDKLLIWNDLYPDWRYARVSNFARDARAARARLLA